MDQISYLVNSGDVVSFVLFTLLQDGKVVTGFDIFKRGTVRIHCRQALKFKDSIPLNSGWGWGGTKSEPLLCISKVQGSIPSHTLVAASTPQI